MALKDKCAVRLSAAQRDALQRLAATGKLGWHDTPKHGSWLSVAETEWSVLARPCLDRRLPDREALRREVAAWQEKGNAAVVKADWQFTAADARVKLKRLYPLIELQ